MKIAPRPLLYTYERARRAGVICFQPPLPVLLFSTVRRLFPFPPSLSLPLVHLLLDSFLSVSYVFSRSDRLNEARVQTDTRGFTGKNIFLVTPLQPLVSFNYAVSLRQETSSLSTSPPPCHGPSSQFVASSIFPSFSPLTCNYSDIYSELVVYLSRFSRLLDGIVVTAPSPARSHSLSFPPFLLFLLLLRFLLSSQVSVTVNHRRGNEYERVPGWLERVHTL